jgi:Zn-dependent peptidase ImmA (M78 family)
MLDEEEKRWLKLFEMLCKNFARLERLVEGDVRFDLPADTTAFSSALSGPAVSQGEQLANLERKRLNLGVDPLDDLLSVLDAMGIKAIRVRLPETSKLSGGFLFVGEVGPCILINSSIPFEEQMVAAAHQYCHFVADYNPYLPRLCLCGPPTGEDISEERAAGFAAAFLLPAASLERLLEERNGVGTGEGAIRALGIYYGVPPWTVAYRLRSLGLDVPSVPDDGSDRGGGRDFAAVDLPRRMVRLALEARAGGLISPLRMARLLQMERDDSEDLYAYCKEAWEAGRDSQSDLE